MKGNNSLTNFRSLKNRNDLKINYYYLISVNKAEDFFQSPDGDVRENEGVGANLNVTNQTF